MKSPRRVLRASVLAAVTLLTPVSALATDTAPPPFPAGAVASLPNLGYESGGLGIDDAGNIYQAMLNRDQSQANTYLAKIAPDGSIVHLFQGVSVSFSVQPDGTIYYTASIDSSPSDGNLYRYSAGVSTLLASGVTPNSTFHGVAVLPNGDVYVGNCSGNGNICKVTGGQVSQIATNLGDLRAAAVDANGNVLMTDCVGGRVISVDSSGSVSTVISGLNYPQGITVDRAGNIWVGASFANQIYQYSPSGERLQTFSDLYDNEGIAISNSGEVYVGLWLGGIADLGAVAPGSLTVPSAPTANASPANGALSVTWTAPASNGGAAITGYTATATAASSSYSCTSTTMSCTITGLTNGTTYSVSVVATNAKGNSTPSNAVSIYPAPDTKFLAYSPKSVILVKSNFQVLVANAKVGALVTVTAAGATKTCTANAVGECTVTLNSTKSAGWVIVASYVDGRKTVSTSSSYRVNIANITVSSVQVAKGKSFTVKISSGAPNTKFQVVTSTGTTYSVTLTGSGAGTITVATKSKGPLTFTTSNNGILLQTTTVAVV